MDKIQRLLDYVRSLDFVQSVEPASDNIPDTLPQNPTPGEKNGFVPITDIKKLYPNQWVLIADAQKEGASILGGHVLCNDSDKRQFALKAKDLIRLHQQVTHFFTGEITKQARTGLMRKVGALAVRPEWSTAPSNLSASTLHLLSNPAMVKIAKTEHF
jgi:hypothetical protein